MNKGITMAVMSSLTFSIMNVLVKLVSTRIPSSEITFFRGLISILIWHRNMSAYKFHLAIPVNIIFYFPYWKILLFELS